MGDYILYQPLTRTDRMTVFLYRAGIALTCLMLAALAAFGVLSPAVSAGRASLYFDLFLALLYFAAGLNVFFIHLYIGGFKRKLIGLYFIALAALAVIFIKGDGDALSFISVTPPASLLFLPLAGCIGFVAAKEAFCFRLAEGYLLAMAMPLYLVALSTGGLGRAGIESGLMFIAAFYVFFTFRKIFMPIHCDIGDKSSYR